jgi:hypothetical protein
VKVRKWGWDMKYGKNKMKKWKMENVNELQK